MANVVQYLSPHVWQTATKAGSTELGNKLGAVEAVELRLESSESLEKELANRLGNTESEVNAKCEISILRHSYDCMCYWREPLRECSRTLSSLVFSTFLGLYCKHKILLIVKKCYLKNDDVSSSQKWHQNIVNRLQKCSTFCFIHCVLVNRTWSLHCHIKWPSWLWSFDAI